MSAACARTITCMAEERYTLTLTGEEWVRLMTACRVACTETADGLRRVNSRVQVKELEDRRAQYEALRKRIEELRATKP
jgi:hypothetical protein